MGWSGAGRGGEGDGRRLVVYAEALAKAIARDLIKFLQAGLAAGSIRPSYDHPSWWHVTVLGGPERLWVAVLNWLDSALHATLH